MESVDVRELEKAFRQQVYRCQELLECDTEDESIVKAHLSSRSAVTQLNKFLSASKKKQEQREQLLKSCMHHYSHSILDYTFYHESVMTGSKFADHFSLEIVCGIIHTISLPAQVCGRNRWMLGLLGTEILECLHWRVGALLYMYCYSMFEQWEGGVRIDKDKLSECCCAGVCHLRLMLSCRAPLREDEDYLAHDADMVKLLKLGVFSDIHMLSLMYAGDMCYWMWSLSNTTLTAGAPPTSQSLQPRAQSSGDQSNTSDHASLATPTTQEQPAGNVASETKNSEAQSMDKVTSTASSISSTNPVQSNTVSDGDGCEQVTSPAANTATLQDTDHQITEKKVCQSTAVSSEVSVSTSNSTTENEVIVPSTSANGSSVELVKSRSEPTVEPQKELNMDSQTQPTVTPQAEPSLDPQTQPTVTPQAGPTMDFQTQPTVTPQAEPSLDPQTQPTVTPQAEPTMDFQTQPTVTPQAGPTMDFQTQPTVTPQAEPTMDPQAQPTVTPQAGPTMDPQTQLTLAPQTMATATPVATAVEKAASLLESMALESTSSAKAFTNSVNSKAEGGAARKPHPPYNLYHLMHHTHSYAAESRWKEDFDPVKQGTELLSKYIETSRGPLKGLGWDYSRAVSLLVQFKKASKAK